MSENKTMPVTWQAQLLRFTAFADENLEPNLSDWWQVVIGEEPDKIDVHPKQKISVYESAFNLGRLLLQVQPGRIDWIYAADDVALKEIPILGVYSNVIHPFIDTITKWLNSNAIPSLNRLAYGAILLCPVTSRKESYTQLAQLLPVDIDTENSTDFFYQINRPRTIDDITINRLSKWSTLRSVFIPSNQVKIATKLEIDVNTSSDEKESIDSRMFGSILETLINWGNEIAEKGDIG